MKKYTWNDIINSNLENIYIFWIWSLINKNTLKNRKTEAFPWIAYWFKRIYNIKQKKSRYKTIQDKVYKNLGKTYYINNKNSWSLNTIITNKKDYINWLVIKIKRKDFLYYAQREYKYYLYKTNVYKIDPCTLKKEKKIYDVFILSAKKNFICNNITPYYWYHLLCLQGAYSISENFWKTFEETTYNINWNLIK